jgi:hypothetical protein
LGISTSITGRTGQLVDVNPLFIMICNSVLFKKLFSVISVAHLKKYNRKELKKNQMKDLQKENQEISPIPKTKSTEPIPQTNPIRPNLPEIPPEIKKFGIVPFNNKISVNLRELSL